MISLSILISVIIFAIILVLLRGKGWQYAIISTSLIGLSVFGIQSCEEQVLVKDTEYLIDYIFKAEYYEEWDEWIDQTCTRSCCCDSKGQNCQTETYDCSYRKYHSPKWIMYLSSGKEISIDQDKYLKLVKMFNDESFIELNRDYYKIDGDAYVTYYNKGDNIDYYVWAHSYENRIQASHNIFNYREVSADEKYKNGLYDYPAISSEGYVNSILGIDKPELNVLLNTNNSLIGNSRQSKIWFLIFKDKPLSASYKQESYWKGGNKNEVVICIGIDKVGNIKWTHVFSWTKKSVVKTKIQNLVRKEHNISNLEKIINQSIMCVNNDFQRRSFSDFAYLSIDYPINYFILLIIYIILMILGGIWVIIKDPFFLYKER